jgi:hypothetical protein
MKIGIKISNAPWGAFMRGVEYSVCFLNHCAFGDIPLGRPKDYNNNWFYAKHLSKRFVSIIDGSKY